MSTDSSEIAEIAQRYGAEVPFIRPKDLSGDFSSSDDVVLIHDDLYATGGTMAAATRLIAKFSPKAIYRNCLIELTACPRHPDAEGLEVDSLLKIDVD